MSNENKDKKPLFQPNTKVKKKDIESIDVHMTNRVVYLFKILMIILEVKYEGQIIRPYFIKKLKYNLEDIKLFKTKPNNVVFF